MDFVSKEQAVYFGSSFIREEVVDISVTNLFLSSGK